MSSTSSRLPEAAGMASLSRRCQTGLMALQQIQKLYDNDMWDIDQPAHSKVRHIHIHLSTTVGRLASLIEPDSHHSQWLRPRCGQVAARCSSPGSPT